MEQLKMIHKVREVAESDDAVSAVLMYGSFTKGEGDQWSDIEFYVFLREGKKVDNRAWVGNVREVEAFFTNDCGTDVAIFDNLVRGEFHFLPFSEIGVVRTWQGHTSFEFRDKMNFVDKDGLLTEVLASIDPPLVPERDTPGNIEWLANSLLNNMLFAGNLIRRGEFAHAHNQFFFLQRHLLWLIRIREGNTKHWESPTKNIEADISPEWYEKYKCCVPGVFRDSLCRCWDNVARLAEKLFAELNVPERQRDLLARIKAAMEGAQG